MMGKKLLSQKMLFILRGDGKYCIIRTVNETVRSSKTLSGVLELLPQYCFFRVHKSYAVNLYFVKQITTKEILLKNGEKVLLSRNNISKFKMAYKKFIKDYYLKV